MNRQLLAPLLVLFSSALLSACGGGGGGTPSGSGDFLITDAPSDELLSFTARITEVRLERDDGSETGSFLGAPVTLEFLSLQGISAWLSSAPVPEGTYSGVVVRFDPGSLAALALDGSPVAVNAISDVLEAAFPAAVDVVAGGYTRFETDLSIDGSLLGDVSSGSLSFSPSGSASSSDGGFEAPIDEIKGVVLSADAAAGELVIDGYADGDLTVPLGAVDVSVAPGTALLGDDNVPFASASAFFDFLVPGQTLLEVHGNLGAGGTVQATKIEVEDQFGGLGGGDTLVRIEGLVTDLTASTFELLIIEIEKGAAVAGPVLAGLGNPTSITVSYDASTVFLLDDDIPTTSDSLALGQEVKARFAQFTNPPFPAFEVEIDTTPSSSLALSVTEPTDEVGVATVRVLPGLAGSIGGGAFPVGSTLRLDLGSAALTLDAGRGGAIPAGGLEVGSELAVTARPGGLGNGADLVATSALVRPGQLVGARVTWSDPATRTLATLDGTLTSSFGAEHTAGPFLVHIHPDAEVTGDVASTTELLALLADPQARSEARVTVAGLGGKVSNELVAHELSVKRSAR